MAGTLREADWAAFDKANAVVTQDFRRFNALRAAVPGGPKYFSPIRLQGAHPWVICAPLRKEPWPVTRRHRNGRRKGNPAKGFHPTARRLKSG